MAGQPRFLHGHGSIYRAGALAVRHVGYSLAEHDDGDITTMRGFVRGDPAVLRPMARANEQLTLVLQDGQRLTFRLQHARPDGSWEVTAYGP